MHNKIPIVFYVEIKLKTKIMKQSFLKFTGKKFLAVAFISASLLLASFNGNATASHSIIELISGSDSNVQYTGSTSDALLFKVNIDNEKAEPFTLTVKNSDGNILFTGIFKDSSFQKQFKILKGDNDGDRYYFTINSASKNLNETYVVSSKTHVVDDVTVNKL